MKITINDDPARGPKVEIEEDGLDMFVIVNGVTIARRGHPGTPEAGTWVSLPGWTVTGSRAFEEDRPADWSRAVCLKRNLYEKLNSSQCRGSYGRRRLHATPYCHTLKIREGGPLKDLCLGRAHPAGPSR
jgi:hypothetical protein